MLAFRACCPTRPLCFQTGLPRDKYVRVDANDYSINPRFVGHVNTD